MIFLWGWLHKLDEEELWTGMWRRHTQGLGPVCQIRSLLFLLTCSYTHQLIQSRHWFFLSTVIDPGRIVTCDWHRQRKWWFVSLCVLSVSVSDNGGAPNDLNYIFLPLRSICIIATGVCFRKPKVKLEEASKLICCIYIHIIKLNY